MEKIGLNIQLTGNLGHFTFLLGYQADRLHFEGAIKIPTASVL